MSFADAFDNYVGWLVLWLFLSSINLAMEAGAYLLSTEMGAKVHAWAQLPSRLGGVVLFVAIIVFVRRRRHAKTQTSHLEFLNGYTMDILKRAALVSFFITLPTVVLLDIVTNHTQLPADFFIKIPSFLLAASFSLSFFFWNRSVRGESAEGVWT